MSDQLERYAAAILGCALAATWAAAGVGAALIALAAAGACYTATAVAQRGTVKRLLAAVGRDLAGVRPSRAPQPRRRSAPQRRRPRQARPAASGHRARPAPRRVYDEPLSEHSLAPAGPYGW